MKSSLYCNRCNRALSKSSIGQALCFECRTVNTDRFKRKPMEYHRYDPKNITKMDDCTNYYKGNGIYGYDEDETTR